MSRYLLTTAVFASMLLPDAGNLPAAESDPPASPSAAATSLLGEQLLREIEPELHGRPERLPVYLQRFRRVVLRDPRQFALEVLQRNRATGIASG